jgi:hypothetical protein
MHSTPSVSVSNKKLRFRKTRGLKGHFSHF